MVSQHYWKIDVQYYKIEFFDRVTLVGTNHLDAKNCKMDILGFI